MSSSRSRRCWRIGKAADGVGPRGRFETWVVSPFNLVALSLVGLLAAHTNDTLAGEFTNFGTLPDVVVFAHLQLLITATTWWTLADDGLADLQTGLDGLWRLVLRGFAVGALIGMAFLLGVILVGTMLNSAPLAALALIALISVTATSIVGGIIGTLSVILNTGCYWMVGRPVG